jgi:putative transposase
MPRRSRVIIPNVAHHVTQRGNNKQIIFREDQDFSNYCYWVNQYSIKYKVSVLAYCLMTNHVHFIVVPQYAEGLSRMFNTVHMRYAQYFNYKKQTSGHLWQGRFFSCVLDDAHLYCAIRYVEQNPVRASMVKYPWDYVWSSARRHVKMPVKKYIKVKETSLIDHSDWKEYLIEGDKDRDDLLRKKTAKGIAFAGEKFITYWEEKLGCVLADQKSGRKKK